MSEWNDLYQEVILEHTKKPRNFGVLVHPDRTALGQNPLCGDQLTITLRMNGDKIEDIRFQGAGCSIFKSSASLMTGIVKNKTRKEIENIFDQFHAMVTGKGEITDESLEGLGAFSGVSDYPVRVKCASLAWHTLRAALDQKSQPVSTE